MNTFTKFGETSRSGSVDRFHASDWTSEGVGLTGPFLFVQRIESAHRSALTGIGANESLVDGRITSFEYWHAGRVLHTHSRAERISASR